MQKRKLIQYLRRGLLFVGFVLILAIYSSGGPKDLYVVGVVVAFLFGFLSGVLDNWLFYTRLRRQQFWVILTIRTLAYLVLILAIAGAVYGIYLSFLTETDYITYYDAVKQWLLAGKFALPLLTGVLLILFLQFFILISRLMGPDVLFNYLLGRYHQPREEERIFMFVDLKASTTIAERLGHRKWHQFLNDFFFDIAKPVRRAQGDIYQYVGDEVVISWPTAIGVKRLNCIHCFFWMWDRMAERRNHYLKRYGYEPIFKAGYHVGVVTIGEIGDYKRDIVFHGDAINTASRIQTECNHYNRRLLLSNTLLEKLPIEGVYVQEHITRIRLRGKKEVLELYSLDPIDEIMI